MDSCMLLVIGIGLCVLSPILVPLLTVGIAAPYEWAQQNPALASGLFLLLAILAVAVWKYRETVRRFFRSFI
jgi:hypothetical protein